MREHNEECGILPTHPDNATNEQQWLYLTAQTKHAQCLIDSFNLMLARVSNEVSKISVTGGVHVREMRKNLQLAMEIMSADSRYQLANLASAMKTDATIQEAAKLGLVQPDGIIQPPPDQRTLSDNEWNVVLTDQTRLAKGIAFEDSKDNED